MSKRGKANQGHTVHEGPQTVDEVEAELDVAKENEDGSTGAVLSLDQKFELLKNQRRRRALRYLIETGDSATTGELAETIAAKENGIDESMLSSSQRKRVYIALYQAHLPKMDDYGVVDFNQARGTITLDETASELEEYLIEEDPIENSPSKWWSRYLGIAVVGGVGYAASLPIGEWLVSSVIALGTIVAIVGCALAHRHVEQSDESPT